jgi:antirestriction protein
MSTARRQHNWKTDTNVQNFLAREFVLDVQAGRRPGVYVACPNCGHGGFDAHGADIAVCQECKQATKWAHLTASRVPIDQEVADKGEGVAESGDQPREEGPC